MKTSLFLFTALFSSALLSEPLYIGQTWPFAEPDMLTEIYETINNNRSEIESKIKKEVAREKKELENLSVKEPISLPRAEENRIYPIDLTYTVENDIYDGEGKLLYPKGYRFNPTNYIVMSKSLVIIDSSDRKQIEWLKKEKIANNIFFKILVCKGSLVPLIKELKQPVYEYTKEVHNRLKLTHTPTIVTQEGGQVFAHEICFSCKSQNKEDKQTNTKTTLPTLKK